MNGARLARGFEPLGDVIARVKARVDKAISERDEAAGSDAHAELIDLQHRQRVILTVRKYSS